MDNEQKIKVARTQLFGYIGGKEVAEKATDEEVLLLIEINDKIAVHFNAMKELEKQVSNLHKTIQSR